MSQNEGTSFPDPYCRELSGRVTMDDRFPFASGGNSNIYRGRLLLTDGHRIRVAIKMIRCPDDDVGQMDRRMRREVEIWRRLKHRNVLPFFGVCDDITPRPVLISMFCAFGHVGSYLKAYPTANRHELVYGVTSGLHYLHENDVVHGDLKPQNVLVDSNGIPCICDFGFAKIITHPGFTTLSVGTVPYIAPELFLVLDDAENTDVSLPRTTKYTDVYSFALLVLEILTSEQPKRRPSTIFMKIEVLLALHPQRGDYDASTIANEMWDVLDHCWAFDAELRPTMAQILNRSPFLGFGTTV
ncbi:kinase-like domain-containing protein [Mycena alexandri]|uniref:Kinase-like domain-containing protein n=1 Tax=Mycena alexandri TaxID=1745969 RepID=A0AAD6SLC5_9AGAR|nr:kinase-like domain-containing protein [Mycena alexandri]